MIRYLDNQEKGRTKDLWREAFPEDSEDFLDYYDQEKMSINQVLVREENDDAAYNDILVHACAEAGIAAFTGDGTNPEVMRAATAAIRAEGQFSVGV